MAVMLPPEYHQMVVFRGYVIWWSRCKNLRVDKGDQQKREC